MKTWEPLLGLYLATIMVLVHRIWTQPGWDLTRANRALKWTAVLRLLLLPCLLPWQGTGLARPALPLYALLAGLVASVPIDVSRLGQTTRRLARMLRGETGLTLVVVLVGSTLAPSRSLYLTTQAALMLLLAGPWLALLWAAAHGSVRRRRESDWSRAGRALCRIGGASLVGSLPLWLAGAALTGLDWYPIPYGCLTLGLVLMGSPWRTRRQPRLSPTKPSPCCTPEGGPQFAAVLLMNLPPQVSAQLFKELGPEQVHAMVAEISKLPQLSPEMRERAQDSFCQSAGWLLARTSARPLQDWTDFEQLCQEWPAAAARLVCELCHLGPLPPLEVRPPAPRSGRPRVIYQPIYKPSRPLRRSLVLSALAGLGLWGLAGQSASPLERLAPSRQVSQQRGLQVLLDQVLGGGQARVTLSQEGGHPACCVSLIGEVVSPSTVEQLLRERLPSGARLRVVSFAPQAGLDCSGPLALTLLASLLGLAAWRMPGRIPPTACAAPAEACLRAVKPLNILAAPGPGEVPEPVLLLEWEVGSGLLSFVDTNHNGYLLKRLSAIRAHMGRELGLTLPTVRVRHQPLLKPNCYVIKIRGAEVARAELKPQEFLAVGPEEKLKCLRGTRTLDPTYGMPATWIAPHDRGDAERLGCMIFDPASVAAVQLTEVVRTHAAELLGLQELDELLETRLQEHPTLAAPLQAVGLLTLRAVLRALLAERVSIRDLTGILETLAEQTLGSRELSLPERIEAVRYSLRYKICEDLAHASGPHLKVIELETQPDGKELHVALEAAIHQSYEHGHPPLLLCADELRWEISQWARRAFPCLTVLAEREVAPGYDFQVVARASWCNKD